MLKNSLQSVCGKFYAINGAAKITVNPEKNLEFYNFGKKICKISLTFENKNQQFRTKLLKNLDFKLFLT